MLASTRVAQSISDLVRLSHQVVVDSQPAVRASKRVKHTETRPEKPAEKPAEKPPEKQPENQPEERPEEQPENHQENKNDLVYSHDVA